MADDPDALDQLLDAALYGPLGMLLELRDRSPELAARGRQHLQTQLSVARMIGQFAVQMGSKQVSAFLQRQGDARASAVAPEAAVPTDESPAQDPPGAVDDVPGAPPTADRLPIDGYDTLAASQVVARLEGLDAEALAVVAAYERGHRNRKTILGKIAQLLRAG